jgi:hypothetical protein
MNPRYRTRVCERRFLNRPGFHAGAYVRAEIEDTTRRVVGDHNFEPEIELEISDCSRRVDLEFDVDSPAALRNSLYKIDTLIAVLQRFRGGIVAESTLYQARERELRCRAKKQSKQADRMKAAR